MDMRYKLFPIFIKEAAKNLKVLQGFLEAGAVSVGAPNELEAAFRAAHTLKGTARLVEVDPVYQIGLRLEALLEKHFNAKTKPSSVEFEAMELAVAWLNQLLIDLRDKRPGPTSFVADALSALELAARYPGETPLVELLDSEVQQRAPQLSDPFAADPEMLLDDEELLRSAKDPFADDPDFGITYNFLPDPVLPIGIDPEPDLGATETDQQHPQSEPEASPNVEIPFDLFADDLSFFADDDPVSTSDKEILPAPVATDNDELGLPTEQTESPGTTELPNVTVAFEDDPFADDLSFFAHEDLLSLPDKEILPASVVTDVDESGLPAEPSESPGTTELPNVTAALEDDPFADDLSFFAHEDLLSLPDKEIRPDPDATDQDQSGLPAEPSEPPAAKTDVPKLTAALQDDPFAEDLTFDEPLVSKSQAATGDADGSASSSAEVFDTVTVEAVAEDQEDAADSSQNYIDSFLLPAEGSGPQRAYVCCCFDLSGHSYYLPIEYMTEIAEIPHLFPLPLAPPLVSGLVNLRGRVLPVIDLSLLAGQKQPFDGVQRLVVAMHQREQLAFLADGIPYLSVTFTGEKVNLPEFILKYKIKGAEV